MAVSELTGRAGGEAARLSGYHHYRHLQRDIQRLSWDRIAETVDALERAFRPLKCWEAIREFPLRIILSSVFGGLIGLWVCQVVWTYENQPPPANPVMTRDPDIRIVDGWRVVTAHYHLETTGECIRTGSYTLERPIPGEETKRLPLGGFMNGASFTKKPTDYDVEFYIPPVLPAGVVFLKLKLHYTCALGNPWALWLRGPPLVVNDDFEAPKVRIVLP